MASLRDIRKHIKSIKSIKQITYAMKMVAAARIKKAQSSMLSARPYAFEMEKAINMLRCEMAEDDFKNSSSYKFFETSNPSGDIGLVLVTSDKGLCGAFNASIIKKSLSFIKSAEGKKIHVITVGKKGRDFLRRIKNANLNFYYEIFGIFPKVNYTHSNLIAENLIKMYSEKKLSKVYFIYNEFKSMISQELKEEVFLPLNLRFESAKKHTGRISDFYFEPSKEKLLEGLIERYIKSQIYRMLLESQAAELSARMNAMENASKNAGELIDGLTLKMNKTRQAMITTELNEIVSGAGALEE
ncbi:MAG: ATP synthase F1 subunit gamma [Elusimicrobiota bacterium]